MTHSKTLGLLVLICILVSMGLAIRYNSAESQRQLNELKDMKVQLDEIAKEQLNQVQQIQKLEQNFKDSLGKASWYDYVLPSGWSSKGHRVCATRDFPRYSTIKVINLSNGKSVECLVTDFGPDEEIHPDRIVDMSSFAFSQIADVNKGIINVQVIKIK